VIEPNTTVVINNLKNMPQKVATPDYHPLMWEDVGE
jgi:hypothetical protein